MNFLNRCSRFGVQNTFCALNQVKGVGGAQSEFVWSEMFGSILVQSYVHHRHCALRRLVFPFSIVLLHAAFM